MSHTLHRPRPRGIPVRIHRSRRGGVGARRRPGVEQRNRRIVGVVVAAAFSLLALVVAADASSGRVESLAAPSTVVTAFTPRAKVVAVPEAVETGAPFVGAVVSTFPTPPEVPREQVVGTASSSTTLVPPADPVQRLRQMCADDPKDEIVAVEGAGRREGWIGDSLVVQQMPGLVTAQGVDRVVLADCGVRLAHAQASGGLERVLARAPDVLVLALGTNDLTDAWFAPDLNVAANLDALDPLLDRVDAADVACTIIVNVANTPRTYHEPIDEVIQVLGRFANDHFARAAERHQDMWVADFDSMVRADGGLLLPDGVHLTDRGVEARGRIVQQTIDQRCPPERRAP